MITIYEKVEPHNIDMAVIDKAGSIIRRGGLVAFPTETVYGLGGDALNPESSQKIYKAKGRPSDNPLIIHISEYDSIYEIARNIRPEAKLLADKYWPGPLTMIFDRKTIVPKETTGGLDTVAVRFPSHPVARKFIEASGGFVAAPSANISGRPSPTLGKHVLEDMDGKIEMIIDSGECNVGLESTIVDLTSEIPMILRPGYVNEEMLKSVIGEVSKDPAVFGSMPGECRPKAPGMKYRHYAPKGTMAIVSGKRENVIACIRNKIESKAYGKRIAVLACAQNASEYSGADMVIDMGSLDKEIEISSGLYDALRRCDEEKIDIIYSEEFDTPTLGMAIMNRLIKAAGHNIIKV